MERIIKQAKQYRLDTIYLGRAHYKSGDLYRLRHYSIGIPTIILSTIVGTSIFVTISNIDQCTILSISTGILSMIAAVLAALQTFFNFSDLSSKHRDIGGKYSIIRRKLDIFILKWELSINFNNNEAISELDNISNELSEIAKSGIQIPQKAWIKAKKEIKALSEEDIKTSVRYINDEKIN